MEGSRKKETDLKIKKLLYICKRCKKELEESIARTEGARSRLRREIVAELNKVSEHKLELEELYHSGASRG
jgi:predicted metal-binding protein